MSEPETAAGRALTLLRGQARQKRASSNLHHPSLNVALASLEAVLDEAEARAAADAALAAEKERVARLRELVDEQAGDEGLWFFARTASEGYLQQELRRLHTAIETALANPAEEK